MDVSIVVPLINEDESLPELCSWIESVTTQHHLSYEVILVDDGLATGSTIRAAVAALYQQGPRRIVIAVPVGAPTTCQELRREVDEVICAVTPEQFYAVGQWYRDFSEVSDETVRELLQASGSNGQVQAA